MTQEQKTKLIEVITKAITEDDYYTMRKIVSVLESWDLYNKSLQNILRTEEEVELF